MAYIYVNPYKASLLAAQNELQQRQAELAFAQQRIAQLQETIRALTPLAEGGEGPNVGLPELCRQILMSRPGCGFRAEDVKDHLTMMGVDISGYANPLAVLHTTLGRLVRPRSGFQKETVSMGGPRYFYEPSLDETTRKTIGQMIAEGGQSWVGDGSAERCGMLGDDKAREVVTRAMARKK